MLADLEQRSILLKAVNDILKQEQSQVKVSSRKLQKKVQVLKQANRELREDKKLLKHIVSNKKRNLFDASAITISAIIVIVLIMPYALEEYSSSEKETFDSDLKTRYLIQNLRGDTIETWKSWKWTKGTTMNVGIVNNAGLDDRRIGIVKDAITSAEYIDVDNSVTHEGPKGTSSRYYLGWAGALSEVTQKTSVLYPPANFDVYLTNGNEGRIIIKLSNLIDADGYTGYTKSTVDGNEVLKSEITIYGVDVLTDDQLASIVRHEFGHALGLGHSTDPIDLMYESINEQLPYVSECNVDALVDLYNGKNANTVTCMR